MPTNGAHPTDRHVGNRVRMRRLMLGLTQTQLAVGLSLTFQQVQKYEKGANRVGAGRLPQIARIFNVPIGALFKDCADTSAGRRTASAAPAKLITDTAVLKLLTAYSDITDRVTRRRLSQLVDGIAKSARKNRR